MASLASTTSSCRRFRSLLCAAAILVALLPFLGGEVVATAVTKNGIMNAFSPYSSSTTMTRGLRGKAGGRKKQGGAATAAAPRAGGCGGAPAGSSASSSSMALKVTVKNTANQQPLSPSVFVLHTADFQLFTVGKPSSDGMRILAETGDPKALNNAIKDLPTVIATQLTDAPVLPGNTTSVIIPIPDTSAVADLRFSYSGMLINTNDGYAGINGLSLNLGDQSLADISAALKAGQPPAPILASALSFDAGTEENNELCSSIPGPACTPESGNVRSLNGEGIVTTPHRGVLGVNVGKQLNVNDLGVDGLPLDKRFTFCGENVGDVTIEFVAAA